jgi:endonuclease/exonuclease/phosphatase family metal-dependent hydrolase
MGNNYHNESTVRIKWMFIKRNLLILFIGLVCLPFNALASYDIIVENNTSHSLYIHTTADNKLPDSASGGWSHQLLLPHQRANVQWFNFYRHINRGDTYQFDVTVSKEKAGSPLLSFHTKIEGDWFGSHIKNVRFHTDKQSEWLFKDNPKPSYVHLVQKKLAHLFKGHTATIGAAAVKYTLPNPHNNYQSTDLLSFTINQPKTSYHRSDNANQLTALNYNVQLWPLYGQVGGIIMNQPDARAQTITEQINDYDVVALQELMSTSHRATISQNLLNAYPYQAGPTINQRPMSGGVMLFSHWPIIDSQYYIYDACYQIDCAAAKGIVYGKINKLGKIYHLFATHLQAAEKGREESDPHLSARQKQIVELAHFIQTRSIASDEPVIVLGDLNVDAGQCLYQGHCERFNFLNQTLGSVYKRHQNHQTLPYSSDPAKNWMVTDTTAKLLDYIMPVKPYLMPRSFTTKLRALRGQNVNDMYHGTPYGDTDLSDHFAIEANFQF